MATKKLTDPQNYSDIADAIRAKNGSQDTYKPGQMAAAIDDMVVGDTLKDAFENQLQSYTYNGTVQTVGQYQGTGLNARYLTVNGVTSIVRYGFAYNSSQHISMPDLTSSSRDSFMRCGNLITLTLDSIQSFDASGTHITFSSVFTTLDIAANTDPSVSLSIPKLISSCQNFDTFIIRKTGSIATLTAAPSTNFGTCKLTQGNGYVYVPSALIDEYKAASNWSTIASQFRALEDYTVDGTITGELDPEKI